MADEDKTALELRTALLNCRLAYMVSLSLRMPQWLKDMQQADTQQAEHEPAD